VNEQCNYVYTYTRAQAIADGVLIDVTEMAKEAGYTIPVAITSGAWGEAVNWTESDTKISGTPQDEKGRLWDVLWMSSNAIRSARNSSADRVPFTFLRVPRGSRKAQRMTLDVHIGGGDQGEPVITILLQDED
jgi:hypothetical protein